MATRLKTIEFAVPQLNTLADNTLTAMTSLTAYIPEFSGTVTFKKAVVNVSIQEGATTTTGNYTSRRIDVNVGGAGATSYTNSNLYTGSGENTCVFYAADITANLVSNWTTGTSKTIDVSVLIDGTATTIAWVNVNATIYITYEYDDTQTTQIKTVYIPLNAPVGTLATSKPGTATATIPALDTELPESSKTYRNMFIITEGNINNTASTTDSTLSMQIDTLTAYTSQSMEMGATSDWWGRWVWDITSLGMTTNATHNYYIWASIARHNHAQCTLVVTYEFDASASTDIFVSLRLPLDLASPMGGTTSTDYQRGIRELWIQEPGTITTKQIAYYLFYDKAAPIAGLNMRIGTGSFVTYTDGGGVQCGSDGCMVRNDAAFTLARGRNTLNFDIYRTDTADLGFNIGGYFIVNYTASKPSQGYGAANHTVIYNLGATFDGVASLLRTTTAIGIDIPETDYFVSGLGVQYKYISNSTGTAAGVSILFEKTSGEGGVEWLPAYVDIGHTDPETGLRICWAQVRDYFYRFTGDQDSSRLDLATTRRWRTVLGNNCTSFDYLDCYLSYHTISYTVGGDISGSNGGTVNIDLHRTGNGELILSTSRSGNGSYAFTWFDNTEDVFVSAHESGAYKGRSDNDTAT